ncbi:MAG: sulfotransferase family 2 domain-containing protein [Candidatus Omnitrophica bacterium]|nr:sulfotransferase family 2 domain-containing protein [Candidatus Omnitrophota bacterium]MDD5671675.1 sulfotransferase family 2 domain-containing protein [Candidatus Omnitrophota bacterium]
MKQPGTIIHASRLLWKKAKAVRLRILDIVKPSLCRVGLLMSLFRIQTSKTLRRPFCRNRYIYLIDHIPKTGGTSIANHLARYLNQEEFIRVYPEVDPSWVVPQNVGRYFQKLSRARKKRIRVVMGHVVGYCVEDAFECAVRKICFIRKPISYAVSLYHHVVRSGRLYEAGKIMRDHRAMNPLYQITSADGKLISFEEWYAMNTDRIQITRRLVRYHRRFSKKASDEEMLGMAKRVLEKFYFVGMTENPEDFLIVFKLLGVPIEYRIENAGGHHGFSEERMKAIESFIHAKSPHEQALYEYALQLNRNFKNSLSVS